MLVSLLTVVLGALFTIFQAYEYGHAAFNYAGHIYGSTFFMATGFHGAHVLIGTIFLLVCLLRAIKGALHAEAALRLRGRGLVLALRRRGLAVPVRLHLRVGRRHSRRRPLNQLIGLGPVTGRLMAAPFALVP